MALQPGALSSRLERRSRRTVDYAGQAYGIYYSGGIGTIGSASRKQGNNQSLGVSKYRQECTCKQSGDGRSIDTHVTIGVQ